MSFILKNGGYRILSLFKTAEKHFDKRDIQTWLKHELLTQYIKNWGSAVGLASNSKNINELHYVDGFAGRGTFKDGKAASPKIAIDNLQELQYVFSSKYKNCKASFHIHIVELLKEYNNLLKSELKSYSKYPGQIHIYEGKFEDKVPFLLDKTKGNPSLYFIDPFGYKGVHMNDIVKILNQRSHEVLINVMSYSLVRNVTIAENKDELCNFFGLKDVDEDIVNYIELAAQINDHETKSSNNKLLKLEDKIINLYIEQIRKNCGKKLYFLKKRIHSQIKPAVYFHLLFATGHRRGLQEMKDAMVKFELIREQIEDTYLKDNDVEEFSLFGDLFSERNEYVTYDYNQFIQDFIEQFNGKKTNYAEIADHFLEKSPLPLRSSSDNKSIYDYMKKIINDVKYIKADNHAFSNLNNAEENNIYVNIQEVNIQTALF